MVCSMRYDVAVESRALKQMGKLPRDVAEDVWNAIRVLTEDQRPRGCRKIRGTRDTWRVVVRADYRVLYEVLDVERRVTVFDVDRREKDTYN